MVIAQPQDLPYQVGHVAQVIQSRVKDPVLTLAALRALLAVLTPRVAAKLFSAELRAHLQPLPPLVAERAQADIEQRAAGLTPEARLLALRKRKNAKNQLAEQGSDS